MSSTFLLETNIPGQQSKQGKVREIFDLGEQLLLVASDRISAFDVIMANGVPDKGAVLTEISKFWFEWLGDSIKNHVISYDVKDFPAPFCDFSDQLARRSMLVKKAKVLPVECIVRGYVAGSGWKSYQKDQTICGHKLPGGLQLSDKLPEPIFTPSTKAEMGEHDENITIKEAADIIGEEATKYLEKMSLDIYTRAAAYAATRGIILADTKFEWGVDSDGDIILIDEVLTPDSSRFWPMDDFEPGREQNSFDKQYVRNYLEEIAFNKQPPGPTLPDAVVNNTRAIYIDAYERLSQRSFKG
jgi:phosphoribosylaminoimidazole-succinocarboxamide synthase